MEYKDLFKGYEGKAKPQSYDFGEDKGLEQIWSISDEEYDAIWKQRFPEKE